MADQEVPEAARTEADEETTSSERGAPRSPGAGQRFRRGDGDHHGDGDVAADVSDWGWWSWRRSSARAPVWGRSVSGGSFSGRRGWQPVIEQFGQMGRVGSLHLPWMGIWFLLLIPVAGGLLYGPLIQRFAKEARGHGVPEVMIAVAEDGGRIRPQVTVVKALASAICIGAGGSVGREGPIVQIGSALASSAGQVVRISESRLRILVACGAAGAISATFNAPITGVFFGFELILREFSIDALFPLILAAVIADVIGRAFFGSGPIFAQMPHSLVLPHDPDYLLVVVLGLAAAFIGVGFKTLLYAIEDVCDRVWKGRPEWCRPAVGGIVLGALLLALPQMYGVGYPVMDKAVAGNYVLWFLVLLMLGKMVAASLTIGIGGSGRRVRPFLVHRSHGRHGVWGHRATPVRLRRGLARHLRRHRHGGRVRRCRPGAAHLHRQRHRDDGQLHPDPSRHARRRSRRWRLEAAHLRDHLHDQAAPAGHRHRTAQARLDAPGPHRRRRHAAPWRSRRPGTLSTVIGPPPATVPSPPGLRAWQMSKATGSPKPSTATRPSNRRFASSCCSDPTDSPWSPPTDNGSSGGSLNTT